MGKNKLILISESAAVLLNIVLWIALAGKFGLRNISIPLHSNVIAGIDLIGNSREVYELPAAGLVVIAVNFFLSRFVLEKGDIWKYFLAISAAFIQVLLLIAASLLLGLNL